jgi:hypothetical protein
MCQVLEGGAASAGSRRAVRFVLATAALCGRVVGARAAGRAAADAVFGFTLGSFRDFFLGNWCSCCLKGQRSTSGSSLDARHRSRRHTAGSASCLRASRAQAQTLAGAAAGVWAGRGAVAGIARLHVSRMCAAVHSHAMTGEWSISRESFGYVDSR